MGNSQKCIYGRFSGDPEKMPHKVEALWSKIVMILVNYLDNIITIIIPQTLVSNKYYWEVIIRFW